MCLDKAVHIIGLFHEDHVAGSVEHVNRGAGQVAGVGNGNDLVFLAPDHLRRGHLPGQLLARQVLLLAAAEQCGRERLQDCSTPSSRLYFKTSSISCRLTRLLSANSFSSTGFRSWRPSAAT